MIFHMPVSSPAHRTHGTLDLYQSNDTHYMYLSARMLSVALSVLVTVGPALASAAPVGIPRIESSTTPERSSPLLPFSPSSKGARAPVQPQTLAPAAATESVGANLIPNASLESGTSLPTSWHKGGYGTNSRTLDYPVSGSGGSATRAIRVGISGYQTGDAKWYFDDVTVTPSTLYEFSDVSLGTAPSIITLRITRSNGQFLYTDIAQVPARSSFGINTARFTTPADAVSVTVFHLLKQDGSLTTDEYSLREVSQSGDPTNYIQNPGFENPGTAGLPAGWSKGGYGTNTRTLTYPVAGQTGNGARVTVSNYVSGDAKWYFAPVSLPQGTYTYSDAYQATIPSILTVQFRHTDGSYTYQNIATVPASSAWATASGSFSVGTGIAAVTVFHLIKGNGTLTIDDAALRSSTSGGSDIFSTGAVTFRFDDNLSSQLDNAVPQLEANGFTASFYVISHETGDDGFDGFMTHAQILDLRSRGFEIGAHTRTHPDLTTLTASQQQAEICGSRQDILSWGVSGITTFAYPFGAYDASTNAVVRSCFDAAATSNGGYVTPSSDPYQLARQSIQNSTTLAQVRSWVDAAAANHTWLILEFHGIEHTGDRYSMTPELFAQVVAYVKQKGIPVVSVAQGSADL